MHCLFFTWGDILSRDKDETRMCEKKRGKTTAGSLEIVNLSVHIQHELIHWQLDKGSVWKVCHWAASWSPQREHFQWFTDSVENLANPYREYRSSCLSVTAATSVQWRPNSESHICTHSILSLTFHQPKQQSWVLIIAVIWCLWELPSNRSLWGRSQDLSI